MMVRPMLYCLQWDFLSFVERYAIQSVLPAMYPLLKDNFGFTFADRHHYIGVPTDLILQPFVGRYADRHLQPYSLSLEICFTLVGLLVLALASISG